MCNDIILFCCTLSLDSSFNAAMSVWMYQILSLPVIRRWWVVKRVHSFGQALHGLCLSARVHYELLRSDAAMRGPRLLNTHKKLMTTPMESLSGWGAMKKTWENIRHKHDSRTRHTGIRTYTNEKITKNSRGHTGFGDPLETRIWRITTWPSDNGQ